MSTLRQNLAYLMDMHQLSANALALASGASQPTISRILSGESTDPRVQSIQPIADYFKVDVEDLRSSLLSGADSIQLLGAISSRRPYVKRIPRPATYKPNPDLYKRIEDEAKALLPPELKKNFKHQTQPLPGSFGAAFHCDYVSDKLLFDLKVLTFRQESDSRPSFGTNTFSGVFESLWHIASLRLLNMEQFPHRRHIMFVVFVDESSGQPSSLVTPPTVFHTIQAQARLHGIALLQSTPALIASTVMEAEGL